AKFFIGNTIEQSLKAVPFVTGTSLSQHEALHDSLDHDEKYDRLLEYIQIVQLLIEKSPSTIDYEGKYYQVSDLALVPPVAEELQPGYFVAGHSEKASLVKESTGAVGMQMLMPGLVEDVKNAQGIHFGLMTRKTESEAWQAAHRRFPESERGKYILEKSMNNTDSVWKKRLKFAADTMDQCDNGYWLAPFRSFQADCPYFIGSHEQVKDLVVSLVQAGIEHIILDVPPEEEDFSEVATAFRMAEKELKGEPVVELSR
ncbi:MAG: LLM class flavin-dependent oxidoreductase, partial [Verrucomicrobiales bacterium]|nr:LLM class flavin-dependent oxidoreductase [Verrucomicrobiales bacterium]